MTELSTCARVIVPEKCSLNELTVHCRGIATQYESNIQRFQFLNSPKGKWYHTDLCIIEYEMEQLNKHLRSTIPSSDALKFGLIFSCCSFGLSLLPFGVAILTIVQRTKQYIRKRNREFLLPKGLHMKLVRDKGSKDAYQTYVVFTRLRDEEILLSDSSLDMSSNNLKSNSGSERSIASSVK